MTFSALVACVKVLKKNHISHEGDLFGRIIGNTLYLLSVDCPLARALLRLLLAGAVCQLAYLVAQYPGHLIHLSTLEGAFVKVPKY